MRAHEAGALHAEAGHRGPVLADRARRPERPGRPVVVRRTSPSPTRACSRSPGVSAARPRRGVRYADCMSSTRTTSGHGPARSSEAFAGADVYYAGKAFLSVASVRWIAEEGLNLDVCSGGELAVALRGGLRPEPDRLPRQQQEPRPSWRVPSRSASAGSSSTHRLEIERLAAGRGLERRSPTGAAAGHRRRRGAHARVHRDRARGPEVRVLDRRGRRRSRRCRRSSPTTRWSWSGCTPTSVRRSSTPQASRSPPDASWLCTSGPRRPGSTLTRARSRWRLRHRLHDAGRPGDPGAAGRRDHRDRRARVPGARHRRPAPVDRAGPRDRRARRRSPSTRSERSRRWRWTPERAGSTSPSTAG